MTITQQHATNTLWPRLGIGYCRQTVDLNTCFGRSNPEVLEIGPGIGTATVEIAKRLPDTNSLVVDVYGSDIGNLLELIEEGHLGNIRVMQHDAVEVTEGMLADASPDDIHIPFPDPWYKRRHNKRYLVQAPPVARLLPKLKSDGYIRMATGRERYAA